MRLQLSPFAPVIRVVVMSDVAQQQTRIGPMHDQPDIAVHPNRPESSILGLIKLVKLQTRMSRIQLQIECRGLYGLLLIAGEFGEAVRKCVGNSKFHPLRIALSRLMPGPNPLDLFFEVTHILPVLENTELLVFALCE